MSYYSEKKSPSELLFMHCVDLSLTEARGNCDVKITGNKTP